MSDTTDLDAQVAQRLFGWAYAPCAYSTDPPATTLVWGWVEAHKSLVKAVYFDYPTRAPQTVLCWVYMGRWNVEASGGTWQEALCRAALAMAEVLCGGGKKG